MASSLTSSSELLGSAAWAVALKFIYLFIYLFIYVFIYLFIYISIREKLIFNVKTNILVACTGPPDPPPTHLPPGFHRVMMPAAVPRARASHLLVGLSARHGGGKGRGT